MCTRASNFSTLNCAFLKEIQLLLQGEFSTRILIFLY